MKIDYMSHGLRIRLLLLLVLRDRLAAAARCGRGGTATPAAAYRFSARPAAGPGRPCRGVVQAAMPRLDGRQYLCTTARRTGGA